MKNYISKSIRKDDVFVTSELVSLSELTGKPVRKGMEQAVISNGKIVNVVSTSYGHLPNEDFFAKAEIAIIEAGLKYETRSINREDRQFVVDYVLMDDSFVVKMKSGLDKGKTRQVDEIRPMLRFANSYDGMLKASGSFGFYRLVCTNGLMVAQEMVNFRLLHKGQIAEVAIPKIGELVEKFISNEYYELSKKFEVLAERAIKADELEGWVKMVADKTGIFTFEKSAKNPEPSLNARMVIEGVQREAALLEVEPNQWLGYNAFNEVLHDKLKKGFDKQKQLDQKLFETVLGMN